MAHTFALECPCYILEKIRGTAAFICLSLYLAGIIDSKTAQKNFGSGNVMIVAGLWIAGDAMFSKVACHDYSQGLRQKEAA